MSIKFHCVSQRDLSLSREISDSYIFITKPTLANASIYFVCWGTGGPSWVWNNYVLICFVFSWSIILVICGYKSHSIFELFIWKLNRKKGSKHEHLTSATAISKISNFFHFRTVKIVSWLSPTSKPFLFLFASFEQKKSNREIALHLASEYMLLLNAFDKMPFTGGN